MDSWEVEKCGEGREVEQIVASHVRIKRSSRQDPGSLTTICTKSSHIVCYVPKMSVQLNVLEDAKSRTLFSPQKHKNVTTLPSS